MFGAGSQAKTGEMVEVTTVEGIKKLQKAADKVHANGGKVVGTIVCAARGFSTTSSRTATL